MTLSLDTPTMDFKVFPTVDKIAQKSVLRATLSMSVHEVSQLMRQHNVSSVVIEHADRKSILSIEDLLKFLNNGGSGRATLNHVPEHQLSTIHGNEHILTALERLNASGDRYLAVENPDGSLLGILTYTDLLASIDPTLLIDQKTIGELISRTLQITFSPDWFLEDVLCHFKKLEDSIVVVEDGIPLGIITTKDVFRIVASGESTDQPLSAFMTSPVVTAHSTWTINEAFVKLKTHNIKRLVVINDQNKLVGVITQSELVGFAYGSWIALSKHHSGELRELVSILDNQTTQFGSYGMIDPISGLGNRQTLLVKISQEIDRIRRYRCPGFCLLLLTLKTPATAGQDKQQAAIVKKLASALPASIRATDDVCLWDEQIFALLLPQTDDAQAMQLVTRTSENLFNLDFLQQYGCAIRFDCYPYLVEESASDYMEGIAKKLRTGMEATATTTN